MKIHPTLFGFYKPVKIVEKQGIAIGDFISSNLNGLLEVVCPEPHHKIKVITQRTPIYMPIFYIQDGLMETVESGSEKLVNTFLIDEPLIESECAQLGNDDMAKILALWNYAFLGVRYKIQAHVFKPEELFGFRKDAELETVFQDDAFFANFLAVHNLESVIKGAPLDPRSFVNILKVKATEYRGDQNPDEIIKQYHAMLEQYATKRN